MDEKNSYLNLEEGDEDTGAIDQIKDYAEIQKKC